MWSARRSPRRENGDTTAALHSRGTRAVAFGSRIAPAVAASMRLDARVTRGRMVTGACSREDPPASILEGEDAIAPSRHHRGAVRLE